ncbi:MAG: hypothetical protein AAB516_00560 [Patescibacteria group bacterium]
MDKDIQKLINMTTIVRVFDNTSLSLFFGDEYYIDRFNQAHLCGFEDKQHTQTDLHALNKYWDKKFKSSSDKWGKELQNYQFLYDSFKLFYYSFEQLGLNKIGSINKSRENKLEMLHLNELVGTNVYGMYHHGKKCIDLLNELKLLELSAIPPKEFTKKFSETRNKLIEHNYNPKKLELLIEPSIWSLVSTNSLLEAYIHKTNAKRACDVYVDYYEDYFQLEKIIVDIIKKF